MFYLIDKPYELSSFDVIRQLRKTLGIKKMGHAGTLDPLATGALLIATENSTKLLPLLDTAKKEYIFTVRLDGTTASWDLGTPVIPHNMTSKIGHTVTELRAFLLGQTTQKTPKYSALHIDGERAYNLARAGVEFDTPERPIIVHDVEIIEILEDAITIRMMLSSGGYIRSFAPLIGEFFGLPGAYVSSLRRTSIYHSYGMLDISSASRLDSPVSISYHDIFPSIPIIDISSSTYESLLLGKTIPKIMIDDENDANMVFFIHRETGYISLLSHENEVYTIIKNNVG